MCGGKEASQSPLPRGLAKSWKCRRELFSPVAWRPMARWPGACRSALVYLIRVPTLVRTGGISGLWFVRTHREVTPLILLLKPAGVSRFQAREGRAGGGPAPR